jgi:hypothetical protein
MARCQSGSLLREKEEGRGEEVSDKDIKGD